MLRTLSIIVFVFVLLGCDTNPVSGKRQFTLMTMSQEIALGEQQYFSSQQSQGGQYLIDAKVQSYVSRIGNQLAAFSAQPQLPYEFVVLNNDVPNAWALPGGKIAINRGLLNQLEDESQLAAVLSHEIVHAAARHGAERQATNLGIGLLAGIAASQTDNPLLQQGAMLGATGFQARYSRDNELEADHYGIDMMVAAGYDPQGAVELQQTFLELSNESGRRSDWFGALFASHPPSQERVDKNRVRAQNKVGGKRNQQAFRQATASIRRDQVAYEKHQQALTLVEKKQLQSALSAVKEAIRLQSKEARFYLTQAQILSEREDDAAALISLNKAVRLDSNYFATHLRRGLLHQRLKNDALAKKDLLNSRNLLETSIANYYLGEIALRNQNKQQAIQFYQQASRSGGAYGKRANLRLQELRVAR